MSHTAVDDVITADPDERLSPIPRGFHLPLSLSTTTSISVMDEIEQENPSYLEKIQKRKRILDDKGIAFFLAS